MTRPSICFVGLDNLPVIAPEYGQLSVGGAELQQTLLATRLARRGYRVSMVVADYGQRDRATWRGVETFKAYGPSAGIPILRFIHPRWTRLWAAMKRADADIYYVSCAGALVGQVAAFVRLHGRKMIFRVASDGDCDPAKMRNVRFWRDRKLYAYGLRRADTRLAQTARQQAALRLHFNVDSDTAPSLVEPGNGQRAFADRAIDVLWAGVVYDVKRPEICLDLARRLPDLSFCMLGGPAASARPLFDRMKAQANSLSNIRMPGHVPYHGVGEFFETARIFINTSELEGFPNTYLQAWGCGVPVVAFFDPDGMIAKEKLGQVVRTVEEMADAVRGLRTDAAAWCAVSARCKAFMASRYSEDASLEPFLRAIGRLSRN